MIHEVWPTNAEVQDIDLLQDGIIEGIQEPRSVGHLREILWTVTFMLVTIFVLSSETFLTSK